MPGLVDCLKLFNRKERYWVVQRVLGPSRGQEIDEVFRSQLSEVLGFAVPHHAYWAIDYHLDWLVAALELRESDLDRLSTRCNASGMIKGNQEDVDLLVAFDDCLILIEAKGATSWLNEQLDSKAKRLDAMVKRYAQVPGMSRLDIRFVLMSPSRPLRLATKDGSDWPSWMCGKDGRLVWVNLQVGEEGGGGFLAVARCDEDGTVRALNSNWRIVPA